MENDTNQEHIPSVEEKTNDTVFVRPKARGKRGSTNSIQDQVENEAASCSLPIETPVRRSARIAKKLRMKLVSRKSESPGRSRKRSSSIPLVQPLRKSLRLSRGKSEEPTTTTNHEIPVITQKRAGTADPSQESTSRIRKRKVSSTPVNSKKVNNNNRKDSSTSEPSSSRDSTQNSSSTSTEVNSTQENDWQELPLVIYQNNNTSMLSEESSSLEDGERSIDFQNTLDEVLQQSDNNTQSLELNVIMDDRGDDNVPESTTIRQVVVVNNNSALDTRIQQYPAKNLGSMRLQLRHEYNPSYARIEEDQSRMLVLTFLMFLFIFIVVLLYQDNSMEP